MWFRWGITFFPWGKGEGKAKLWLPSEYAQCGSPHVLVLGALALYCQNRVPRLCLRMRNLRGSLCCGNRWGSTELSWQARP